MASGRQLAEQNLATFTAWAASKTDNDFRAMESRGVLSRKEVATECGFAKSALDQNPRIKTALRELEDALRARYVLPPVADTEKPADEAATPPMREPGTLRAAADAKRLQRLETENASQKAELTRVKAENLDLKRALEKHSILREALAETGRVPR